MSDRAVSPVVGKVLEFGVVVLWIGVVSAALYGGVVPEYRTAAGNAVAERTLARTADAVEGAGTGSTITSRRRVALPTTIRGQPYDVRVRNRTLVLEHPHAAVGARYRLSMPSHVRTVSGDWRSGSDAVVVARSTDTGVVVTLRNATEVAS